MKNIVVYSDGTGQDGGVRPEQRISNIYKLYWTSRNHPGNAIEPHEQVTFYDAGLGTDIGATAITAPVRFVEKMLGSIEGAGIKRNITDCYEFIINHYQPGDRIFLFGFSRGAYTVRCVANALMLCGIPTKTPDGPVMRFRKAVHDIAYETVDTVLEHGAGQPRGKYEAERLELARRFQDKYASGNGSESNVAPYFIGVFDTVAALGATGARRKMIHACLAAGVGLAAGAGVLLPSAIVGATSDAVYGTGFWSVFLSVLALTMIGANVAFWRWQKAANVKTIRDFPNKGDVSSHIAEWKGANFDRLLSRHVGFARSANAIDETRADFDRVPWGPVIKHGADDAVDQIDLVQMWFAGNHSDIGGSYPETESRLSDIALSWMARQATKQGLKTGPIFVNGDNIPGTNDAGEALHLFPSADGVQHCEIAGMRDTINGYAEKAPKWKWLQSYILNQNWPVKVREITPDAPVDPSVEARFALPSVVQCAGFGTYRPPALKDHLKFKSMYPGAEPAVGPGAHDAVAPPAKPEGRHE